MITTPHWNLRDYMHEFRMDDTNKRARHDARLPVLMCFILHANNRLRCWPSTELLCKETGFNPACVVEAREWLIKRKALVLVPFDKRVQGEEKLPGRQYVYQLTGMIEVSSGLKPYLLMTPETAEAVEAELKALELNVSLQETLDTPTDAKVSEKKTSRKETSLPAAKGITSIKGSTIPEDEEKSAPAREIPISTGLGMTPRKRFEPVAGLNDQNRPRFAEFRKAILAAFNYSEDVLTDSVSDNIRDTAIEFTNHRSQPDAAIVKTCYDECKRRGWEGFTPKALLKVLPDVLSKPKVVTSGIWSQTHVTAPEPPAPTLSAEERAALVANGRAQRAAAIRELRQQKTDADDLPETA